MMIKLIAKICAAAVLLAVTMMSAAQQSDDGRMSAEARNWEHIINGGVVQDLPISLSPSSVPGRWRVVGDPALREDMDFGGILAKVTDDGKFERVKPEDLGVMDDFVIFGDDNTSASKMRIISSGHRDFNGKLRLTGTRQAGGRDVRSMSMGWASIKDTSAGLAGALGLDDTAEGLRDSADETREYNLRMMNAAGRAYHYNEQQKPFDILDAGQLRNIVILILMIGVPLYILGYIFWLIFRKD